MPHVASARIIISAQALRCCVEFARTLTIASIYRVHD